MKAPRPISPGTGAVVLIVLGPVPFMVTIVGSRQEEVIEAYRRAGLHIQVLEERRAAS